MGVFFHIYMATACALVVWLGETILLALLFLPPWIVCQVSVVVSDRRQAEAPRKLWTLRPLGGGEASLRMRPMRLRGIKADAPFREFVRREILAAEEAALHPNLESVGGRQSA